MRIISVLLTIALTSVGCIVLDILVMCSLGLFGITHEAVWFLGLGLINLVLIWRTAKRRWQRDS